jgi:hypothetical protein
LVREEVWSYLRENQASFALPQPMKWPGRNIARVWSDQTSKVGRSLNDFANEVYERLLSSGKAQSTVLPVYDSTEMHAYNAYYPTHVKFLILEEVFELIRAGVLIEAKFSLERPRMAYDLKFDFGQGWVVLTDYGERCMQENRILPHDPEGYLADLQRRCVALDLEVEVLARESLLTFQANCLVASVILIGAASERLIRVLFESYRDAYQNQSDRDRLDWGWEHGSRRSIVRKFEWLWQELEAKRTELNNADRLWDGAEGLVRATFDMLRTARNEAVHQNRHFERIQANELLFLFVPYAERVCSLINYFQGVTY